jgi:DNA helicase II / ATP-dependent DNA helicase PcrA
MRFYADLHIHSKYSRATSRDADLQHIALWARRKGVAVVATGDFTHPGWMGEIRENLVPAEPGLFRLRDDDAALALAPASCRTPVRFMLEVEISTIYKKDGATRKVHHLVYAPDIASAERFTEKLARVGNLASDGRPILGLDSRSLLEMALESGEGCFLVPAHIWTPWFSVLGSKSGFDRIEDCYEDLAPHVFAIETGLSADPAMMWRLSALDRFRLISNSDAHSPPRIGREACRFDTPVDYFAMRRALETGAGFGGTIEFFPEEGKYHLDGHRNCGTRMTPAETARAKGLCPVCGKPVTVGVMNRVDALADRANGTKPEGAAGFTSLIPLAEVVGEIRDAGPATKGVQAACEALVSRLGGELYILEQAPLEEIRKAGSALLAEAIGRMRAGQVVREAGYDGEFGAIRVFAEGEMKAGEQTLTHSDRKEKARGRKSRPLSRA